MPPRDAVRVMVDKLRVGVVLRDEGDRIRVITGSTQDHDLPRVEVRRSTRQGRILDLSDTTYFYGRDAVWVVSVATTLGRCSFELFLALAALVEEWDVQQLGG